MQHIFIHLLLLVLLPSTGTLSRLKAGLMQDKSSTLSFSLGYNLSVYFYINVLDLHQWSPGVQNLLDKKNP